MTATQHTTIRLVLGDQLTHTLSALRDIAPQDVVLMCEVHDEATYVKHHKKKIALLFSAMRHFAAELEQQKHQVDYIAIDDADNQHSFVGELARAVKRHQAQRVIVTMPGEYRVLQAFKTFAQQHEAIAFEVREDDRFLCSPQQFARWAKGKKQLRMEYFYREMRRQYDILMDNGQPVGGQWNYDQENRKPPKAGLQIPQPKWFEPDAITQQVIQLVATHFDGHFGALEPFEFAVTRQQALQVLAVFIEHRLPLFGTYQDAMVTDEAWMFHAHISFYLNCGYYCPWSAFRQRNKLI